MGQHFHDCYFEMKEHGLNSQKWTCPLNTNGFFMINNTMVLHNTDLSDSFRQVRQAIKKKIKNQWKNENVIRN